MSQAEIQRLAADLRSDAALRHYSFTLEEAMSPVANKIASWF